MEQRDHLLSSMHEAQAASGRHFLKPESLRILERRYRLSKAELRGLASYYSMYSLKARGRHLIKVCDSPVCRMLGSGTLLAHLEKILGIREGQTDAGGAFTLERCQCLGHCADAPLVSIDEQIVPAQDERVLQARIEALKAGESGATAREGGRHGH